MLMMQTTTHQSAVAVFGEDSMPMRIHSDHRGMVKFDDRNHVDYKNLENHIIKMIRPRQQRASSLPGEEVADCPANPNYAPGHSTDNTSPPPGNAVSYASDGQSFGLPRPSQYIYYNNYFGNASSQQDQPQNYGDPFQGASTNSQSTYQDIQGAQRDPVNRHPGRQHTFPPTSSQAHRPGVRPQDQASSDPALPVTHELDSMRLGSNSERRDTFPNRADLSNDDDPFNRLIMFDTVFIIDDTGSMILPIKAGEETGKDRWTATVEALKHITGLAVSKDVDGIEIRFLKDDRQNDDNVDSVDTIKEKLSGIDMFDGRHGGGTIFKEHLEDAISWRLTLYEQYLQEESRYKDDLRRLARDRQARARLVRPRAPKKLNLIVITDGKADDKQEVEDYIIKTARDLDRLGAPDGQIGIQFVQIGEDEAARVFLKRLDDDLESQDPPIRDVSRNPYIEARL